MGSQEYVTTEPLSKGFGLAALVATSIASPRERARSLDHQAQMQQYCLDAYSSTSPLNGATHLNVNRFAPGSSKHKLLLPIDQLATSPFQSGHRFLCDLPGQLLDLHVAHVLGARGFFVLPPATLLSSSAATAGGSSGSAEADP